MGSCLSSSQLISYQSSTTKVITVNGALIEYSSATMVSDVLHANANHTTTSATAFICSSDELCFNEYIPVLPHNAWLDLDQIYFILPMCMLHQPLSVQDMSALAVKASRALADVTLDNTSSRGNKRTVQVVPIPVRELDQTTFSNTVRPTHSHKTNKKTNLRGRHTIRRLGTIQE